MLSSVGLLVTCCVADVLCYGIVRMCFVWLFPYVVVTLVACFFLWT